VEELILGDWNDVLKAQFKQKYFQELSDFVNHSFDINPNNIFPQKHQIFNSLNSCEFNNVKVVILGQDPYPTRGHANGLSFSVSKEVNPLPKSLNNIFKELSNDLSITDFKSGDLQTWATQGVLLLNTVLTVKEGQADSHAGKGWEVFTDSIIKSLNQKRQNIVYILWGKRAQLKSSMIDSNRNLILKSPHPSPLSSYRGFFGCSHFSKCNNYLNLNGIESINWSSVSY